MTTQKRLDFSKRLYIKIVIIERLEKLTNIPEIQCLQNTEDICHMPIDYKKVNCPFPYLIFKYSIQRLYIYVH